MPPYVDILKQSLMFSGLSRDDLTGLSSIAAERKIRSGEFVFWEGDAPDHFYILIEGRIKVIKHSSTGKEFIIAFFGPGEVFGEAAVFEGKPYPASAQAVDDTRILAIKKLDFLSFLTKHPQVALGIINILSRRLREAQSRLRDLAGERADSRLAQTLLMLSSKLGAALPFTRQEIANMAGTTTETAIRVLSNLKERGIIGSVRGKITILDKEKLRLLGEGAPRIGPSPERRNSREES